MAFALKLTKLSKDEIEQRVLRAAQMLDLSDVLNRYPRALSGGQRQRVAMGRAIVRNPDVFLMDEPLSNLDAQLRQQTRVEIMTLQRELNATMLYVTHDQAEAMTMGDRVAVLNRGVLQQFAPPHEVYDRPQSLFVATFFGTPRMNTSTVQVDGSVARLGAGVVPLPASGTLPDRIILGIRSEDVLLDDSSPIRVRVSRVEMPGAETFAYTDVQGAEPGTALTIRLAARAGVAPGDELGVKFPMERVHLFDPDSGARLN